MKLDPGRVPASLHHLIPLAERWGVSDDAMREALIARASEEEIAQLVKAVSAAGDALDEWLAGTESRSALPSREYIAFSAMRMAVDLR